MPKLPLPKVGLKNKPSNVIDRVNNVAMMLVTKNKVIHTRAHHLRNIWVSPLEINVDEFEAPIFVKTTEEQEFIRSALVDNFLFTQLNATQIQTMVDAFEPYTITTTEPQECIIQQGDEGDYFYILQEGQVRFEVDGTTVGTTDQPGSTFGELALLYSAPRAASVFCVMTAENNNNSVPYYCKLFRVDQKTFRSIMQTQNQQAEKAKLDLLHQITMLQTLDPTDLVKLVRAMTTKHFNKGDYLVHKGEMGDALYIIQEGMVQATDIVIGNTKYEDQVFAGPGGYFGEKALMNEPIVGNAIALTEGIALLIDCKTFVKVVGDFRQLALKSMSRKQLDSCLDSTDIDALVSLIVEERFPKGHVIGEEGSFMEAALYLVREGKVEIESIDGKDKKIIEKGGYFGQDQLLADHNYLQEGDEKPRVELWHTITVVEDCILGVLKLEECRKVLDTTTLGLGKGPSSAVDTDISVEDVTRHTMLGAGSFGQVWLASSEESDGTRQVYALKVQSKYQLIESGQARGVVNEKNIMARLSHPAIIKLFSSSQDKQRLYMLTDLVQGGELFSILHTREYNGISEANAKFYAAGILEGLSFMHRRHIIHRDLKPENVLINEKGYPVIIDLGFAKYVPDKTYTFCGTPLYIAPEVILNMGHDKGADHWSLACMIYDMVEGRTPFYEEDMDQLTLFKSIVSGRFEVAGYMSLDLKLLLMLMLNTDPTRRLGSWAGGSNDIFEASWFSGVNFEKIRRQEIPAPWVPELKDPLDSSNFWDCSHLEDKCEVVDPELSEEEQLIFKAF